MLSANICNAKRHTYEFLLLNELDVSERFRCKLNGLIEPILTSVRHIDDLDDFCLQPLQQKQLCFSFLRQLTT